VAKSPVDAWAASMANDEAPRWQTQRGLGGFVRSSWDEVNEIAAANVYTIKQHGPDRIIGFSPIPAMSMVSYAAGSRYLSLIGGVCMSFYDWYCDLPPASPQVWGEQTDVPESADWYNSTFIIAWGSNVPQTRTPDAHFFTEVRYKGAKTVAVTPDYAEVAKLADLWLHPKQGTDAALAMAMGHVILKEFYFERRAYFDDYARRYTDLPMLVMLKEQTRPRAAPWCRPLPARQRLRRRRRQANPEWKTLAFDESGACCPRLDRLPLGRRRPARPGPWNLEKGGRRPRRQAQAVGAGGRGAGAREVAGGLPYFGGIESPHFTANKQGDVLLRRVPVRRLRCRPRAARARCGGHGVRPAGGQLRRAPRPAQRRRRAVDDGAASYDDNRPTPRPGRSRSPACRAPRSSPWRASSPTTPTRPGQVDGHHRRGHEPLVPLRHELPRHHQHADDVRLHRPSGGGWAHYVGQEKLRPQTGWTALAFALDWSRPPRQQNSPASSTPTPTSGATRSWAWTRCCRRWPTSASSAAA
jgi:nitrate reductase alpha subunit